MRLTLWSLSILLLAAPARAQAIAASCPPAASVGPVAVETVDEGTIRGTLYCLSPDQVGVWRDGQLVTTPLSKVKRVVKPADPVWDGAVKGAAVVLTMWAVACGFCDAGAGNPYIWRAVGGYALLGATLDALHPNRKIIYADRPSPSLNFRLSF